MSMRANAASPSIARNEQGQGAKKIFPFGRITMSTKAAYSTSRGKQALSQAHAYYLFMMLPPRFLTPPKLIMCHCRPNKYLEP